MLVIKMSKKCFYSKPNGTHLERTKLLQFNYFSINRNLNLSSTKQLKLSDFFKDYGIKV